MSDYGSNDPRITVKQLIGRSRVERRFDAIRRTDVLYVDTVRAVGQTAYTFTPTADDAIDAITVTYNGTDFVPLVIGSAHPDDPTTFAQEFRIQEVQGKRGAWEVEWTFSTPDGSGIIDPPPVGYTEVNVDNEVEFQDFFRQNAAIPPQGNAPLPLVAITDGEDIAVDGRPTSLPVRTIRADVSIIVEGWPLFAVYAVVTGRRNDASFLGGVTGSILYTGARSNRISENQWRVTHSFVQDQFFHCRQIGKFSDVGDLVEAYWVQPFPLGDFAFLGLPPL